ncbi:tuberculostearic acid methyltransferase UfaA1 [Colletotrichum spaethianum]|uniref:tryptophan--tRNA ligase n=1 Tax=Colletotrichum spaethianum TaxID=700344 RepID=A0AA37LD42_9PEZI|nr:tuberculostearic acid methyltransferase UfaA1 [Colletotrichum spaethianum]GKT43780.1 tuberculostearic acid methyltransferase UfaA1 [Colletotrichum spaethianum]
MGYLSRMTQWKSKLSLSSDATILDEGAKASLKLGLFSYPVLQAADILVHRATHVPVGDDQKQHLEFARECVTNFNYNFGAHLVSPETITSTARRVMSLQQPNQKMSKSAADPRSRILITDTPEEIHKKIMSARTDSSNHVSYDPNNRPGVSNLVEILSIFDAQGRSPFHLAETFSQTSLKNFKQTVSAAVVQGLEGFRERYFHFLSADEGKYLDAVEAQGANKARLSAEETMAIVREATGL